MAPPPPPPVTAGPPVDPFPRKSDITLVPDRKLKDAVTHAVNDASAQFAISIVDPVNSYAVGGFNGDKEYYTGSLVKVGVLYAAYALLDMVRRYNTLRAPRSADALLKGLRADMDGAIERSSPLVFGGASPRQRPPSYESVFTINNLGGKLQINLRPLSKDHLERMIVNSDNNSAGQCIHGLGFSYLNGALEQGDFFNSGTKKGVWAAGDFKHGWAPVRIPCENLAGGTAQGATTDAMAQLMTAIVLGNVLDTQSHVDMSKLLRLAAHGSDPSFLSRNEIANHLNADQVSHAKIGIGEDPDVLSESEVVKGVGRKLDRNLHRGVAKYRQYGAQYHQGDRNHQRRDHHLRNLAAGSGSQGRCRSCLTVQFMPTRRNARIGVASEGADQRPEPAALDQPAPVSRLPLTARLAHQRVEVVWTSDRDHAAEGLKLRRADAGGHDRWRRWRSRRHSSPCPTDRLGRQMSCRVARCAPPTLRLMTLDPPARPPARPAPCARQRRRHVGRTGHPRQSGRPVAHSLTPRPSPTRRTADR